MLIPRQAPHQAPYQAPHQADLSEVVDAASGMIRARGRLTEQGADLLRGTADSLRGTGHTRVVLDLSDVREADVAGLDILLRLASSFRADGDLLLITHAPPVVTALSP